MATQTKSRTTCIASMTTNTRDAGDRVQSGAPLFCLSYAPRIARYLDNGQPVYALSPWQTPDENQLARMTSIEMIASYCLRDLRSVQQCGPYYLSGFCLHAIIAFEMAQRLLAQGEEVPLLAMFAPPWPWRTLSQRLPTILRRVTTRFHAVFRKTRLQRNRSQGDWNGMEKRVFSAARCYKPLHLASRIELFMPKMENPLPMWASSESGWRNLATGGFRLHFVAGDPWSMFSEPYVQQLTHQLRDSLNEVRELNGI
jgi:thioesterase domain-containing protein